MAFEKHSIFSEEIFRVSPRLFMAAFMISLSKAFIFSVLASPPKHFITAFFLREGGKFEDRYSSNCS